MKGRPHYFISVFDIPATAMAAAATLPSPPPPPPPPSTTLLLRLPPSGFEGACYCYFLPFICEIVTRIIYIINIMNCQVILIFMGLYM